MSINSPADKRCTTFNTLSLQAVLQQCSLPGAVGAPTVQAASTAAAPHAMASQLDAILADTAPGRQFSLDELQTFWAQRLSAGARNVDAEIARIQNTARACMPGTAGKIKEHLEKLHAVKQAMLQGQIASGQLANGVRAASPAMQPHGIAALEREHASREWLHTVRTFRGLALSARSYYKGWHAWERHSGRIM